MAVRVSLAVLLVALAGIDPLTAYERTERGVYQLNSHGEAALLRWPQNMHLTPFGEASDSKGNADGGLG
jgi:hypothetical protein